MIVICGYGQGIPAHLVERIFQPFFRVEEARSLGDGGIGLGFRLWSATFTCTKDGLPLLALSLASGLNLSCHLDLRKLGH